MQAMIQFRINWEMLFCVQSSEGLVFLLSADYTIPIEGMVWNGGNIFSRESHKNSEKIIAAAES